MDKLAIIARYREHVLEHGTEPASVFRFASDLGISEREFFEYFASFSALEASIWSEMVKETSEAVRSGAEWESFSAQQRLLTFYYGFFEKALDYRSFFLSRFPRCRERAVPPSQLRLMKDAFVDFASLLVADGIESGEVACRGRLNSIYPHALFGHFLSAVEFNLQDESEGFERTDAFIEKSVRLAFDLAGTGVAESAFDLVRFLSGRSRAEA